jgi:hypothetical protein
MIHLHRQARILANRHDGVRVAIMLMNQLFCDRARATPPSSQVGADLQDQPGRRANTSSPVLVVLTFFSIFFQRLIRLRDLLPNPGEYSFLYTGRRNLPPNGG